MFVCLFFILFCHAVHINVFFCFLCVALSRCGLYESVVLRVRLPTVAGEGQTHETAARTENDADSQTRISDPDERQKEQMKEVLQETQNECMVVKMLQM